MIASRTQRGLTMVELMMTVAVIGILAAIAIPSFTTLLRNNRAQADASLLYRAFNYARTEAVTKAVEVRVNSLSGGTNWAQGWRVWIDTNGNGSYDSGEELRVQGAMSSGATLTGSVSHVDFLSSGVLDDSGNVLATYAGVYSFLYVMDSNNSYCTTVAKPGRVSQEKKSTCP